MKYTHEYLRFCLDTLSKVDKCPEGVDKCVNPHLACTGCWANYLKNNQNASDEDKEVQVLLQAVPYTKEHRCPPGMYSCATDAQGYSKTCRECWEDEYKRQLAELTEQTAVKAEGPTIHDAVQVLLRQRVSILPDDTSCFCPVEHSKLPEHWNHCREARAFLEAYYEAYPDKA